MHKIILSRGEEDTVQAEKGQGDRWTRACGTEGQDQSTDPGPPQPSSAATDSETSCVAQVPPRTRGGQAPKCGRDVPTYPGTTVAGHERGSRPLPEPAAPAREPDAAGPLCQCCARLPQALGPERGVGEAGAAAGLFGGRSRYSSARTQAKRVRTGRETTTRPGISRCTHRSRPARSRRPEGPDNGRASAGP